MNKKIIVTLCLSVLTLSSCGSNTQQNVNSDLSSDFENVNSIVEETTIDKNAEEMKNAYKSLVTASEKLDEIGAKIQSAWYYGIFNREKNVDTFASAVGLPAEDLKTEIGLLSIYLDNFSYCVAFVQNVMTAKGYYSQASDLLDSAKESLKQVTNDLDNYEDMKNFYSSCNAFYEWLNEPNGSFEQAKDTINNYEKELNDYKNDMEFYYG